MWVILICGALSSSTAPATGIVIGETTVIGDEVKLYQGVTIGALSFQRNTDGSLVKGGRRHPTVEDDVTIYAGATILGGDTVIGRGAVFSARMAGYVPGLPIVRGVSADVAAGEIIHGGAGTDQIKVETSTDFTAAGEITGVEQLMLTRGETATFNSDCLKLADCVVVDVQCDYSKHELGNMRSGEVEMAALEATMKTIGEKVPPTALTLIETTVAPGTTEFVAWPILKKAFRNRGIKETPLLAHSFERVMPGKEYVSSIRDFWRVCSGCTPEARERVETFLHEILNTEEFPLTVMDRPIESETTKIVENSYRATILAYLNEWSLFAERNGVDLIKVIDAIKVRPTHSNMIFPGPGIGGYCLPKDGGLGLWSYKHILGFDDDIAGAAAVPTLLTAEPYTVESLSAELLGLAHARAEDVGLPDGGAWLMVEARAEDAAALLRKLVAHAEVRRFDLSEASLHDIFIRLVEGA